MAPVSLWQQVAALQMKNTKILFKDKQRLALMLLYPVYFVIILSTMKAASKPSSSQEFLNQRPRSLGYPPLTPNGTKGDIAFACAKSVSLETCSGVMKGLTNRTAASVIQLPGGVTTNAYWRAHRDSVIAGIELYPASNQQSIAAYTLRLDNGNLRDVLHLGSEATVDTETEATPGDSVAEWAYVSSGFAFLQHAMNCAIAAEVTGRGSATCDDTNAAPLLAPFPTVHFAKFYSSDDSLPALIPFYMVIAFSNTIVYIVVHVVVEKQGKLVEYVRMHGTTTVAYWMSWYFTVGIVGSVSCALCAVILSTTSLLPRTDLSLIFLILWLYNMSMVPVAFALSTCIKDQRVAAIAAGIGSIVVGAPSLALTDLVSRPLKLSLAAFPPLAMSEALAVAIDFERANSGLSWGNISEIRRGFAFIDGVLFLIVDMIAWFLLALYLFQVLPQSDTGARKPLLFCLLSHYWRVPPSASVAMPPLHHYNDLHEEPSSELQALPAERKVTLYGLKKTYLSGSGAAVEAVSDLSFEMYSGQIFSLLGKNGAGKSTVVSILTGLTNVTAGSARVLGFDATTQMEKIRSKLGFCPQHDTIYGTLSVQENLKVFASLKNVPLRNAEDLLTRLGLGEKRSETADKLSGGMKRALSVAIALIGDPTFLVLDEPTAGMDPAARRRVWDLLLEGKSRRVTLLTTHFLDEADCLSDRVGIMSHGRCECLGTPLFLKNRLGVGYHLTCVPCASHQLFSNGRLMEFVQRRVAGATLTLGSQNTSGGRNEELLFTIPTSATVQSPLLERRRSAMAQLLLDLEQNLETLSLESFGLTFSSLEDVFLRVTSNGAGEDVEEENDPSADAKTIRAFETRPRRPSLLRQLLIILRARLILVRRNWLYNLSTSLMPGLIVLFSLWLDALIEEDNASATISSSAALENELEMVWWGGHGTKGIVPSCLYLSESSSSFVFMGSSEASLESSLAEQARHGSRDDMLSPDFAVFLNQSSCGDSSSFYQGSFTLHFNQTAVNSLPGSLSFMDGSVLFGNHGAFELTAASFEQDDKVTIQDLGIALTLTYLLGMEFSSFSSTFAYDTVLEKKEGRLFQLRVSGASPFAIWASVGTVDLIRWCLPFGIIFTVLTSFGNEPLTGHGAGTALMLACFAIGIQTCASAYAISMVIKEPEYVTSILSQAQFLATIVIYTIVYTVLCEQVGFSPAMWPVAESLIVIGGIFTPAFLIMVTFTCVMQISGYGNIYPSEPAAYFQWSMPCLYAPENQCPGVLLVITSAIVGTAFSFLVLSGFVAWAYGLVKFWWGQCLAFISAFTPPCGATRVRGTDEGENNDIVRAEAMRVKEAYNDWVAGQGSIISGSERSIVSAKSVVEMITRDLTVVQSPLTNSNSLHGHGDGEEEVAHNPHSSEECILIVNEIRKEFPNAKLKDGRGTKVAVDGFCLGVERGQIFGLLGHNGAGKSSLIGMLTGVLEPTSGDAVVAGKSVVRNRASVLQSTGFCPQSGGTWSDLTVREHLSLFASLRGFGSSTGTTTSSSFRAPGVGSQGRSAGYHHPFGDFPSASAAAAPSTKELLDEVEAALGLTEHSNKRCKELSGGTQRKLSACLALLGAPSMVYLDEPSTGVDVATRRRLWAVIRGAATPSTLLPSLSAPQPSSAPRTPQHPCESADRAVLLTTHNMTEAEALSHRIGIMVGGRVRALGSPQELKSRHGQEYQLDLKLLDRSGGSAGNLSCRDGTGAVRGSTASSSAAAAVESFICSKVPGTALSEHIADSMRFTVPAAALDASQSLSPQPVATSATAGEEESKSEINGRRSVGLGFVFDLLESHSAQLGIGEFSLSQTTLERVFLQVAAADAPNEASAAPQRARGCLC